MSLGQSILSECGLKTGSCKTYLSVGFLSQDVNIFLKLVCVPHFISTNRTMWVSVLTNEQLNGTVHAKNENSVIYAPSCSKPVWKLMFYRMCLIEQFLVQVVFHSIVFYTMKASGNLCKLVCATEYKAKTVIATISRSFHKPSDLHPYFDTLLRVYIT